MTLRKRKKRAEPITIAEPTPEQQAKGVFLRLTIAYRRIPVIDTMAQTGKLSRRQFDGLARYRDVAIAEERSPIRDSLDKALHGRGGSDGAGHIRTAYELVRLEDALGSLYSVARAIAVDDTTVSQWAARRGANSDGTAKRCELDAAMLEIKMAGERLAAAIGA